MLCPVPQWSGPHTASSVGCVGGEGGSAHGAHRMTGPTRPWDWGYRCRDHGFWWTVRDFGRFFLSNLCGPFFPCGTY